MCDYQARVIGRFITSDIYHFFVLGKAIVLPSSYLEIYDELLMTSSDNDIIKTF